MITGAILQRRLGKDAKDSDRTESAAKVTRELNSVLAPFVLGSMDGGQRGKNLDMILTRSSHFAFLLFSQPGSFRFDFSRANGGLVVFPALVQTVGDQGQPMRPARVLSNQEIVI